MSLIAQYLFNNNCNSETGNYNGTGSRVTYKNLPRRYGIGGKSLIFDGWESNISGTSGGNRTSISFSSYNWNSTWTIETWFRRFHPGNCDLFLHAGTNWANNQLLHVGINNENKLRLGFYGNDLDAPGTYTDTNWHHLVFTYNHSSKARQIWMDGTRVANDTASSTLNATSTWYVGWYQDGRNMCGELANLRIWNEVLSDNTIQSHYNTEKPSIPVYSYGYTGNIQTFTAPVSGYYQLEAWGAAGGGTNSYSGGVGGYSTGVVHLQSGQQLYVGIGKLGNATTSTSTVVSEVFNGGGAGRSSSYSGSVAGSGGGATHIATATGELKDLSGNQNSVLIVAGGGGGGHYLNAYNGGKGGHAGGFQGNGGFDYKQDNKTDNRRMSNGGTQTAGGTTVSGDLPAGFGYGSSTTSRSWDGSGGGGGWYGGSGSLNGPGGGGSGYIKPLLSYGGITKRMTGYNVTTSSAADTKTESNTGAHYAAFDGNEMRANGFAQITLIDQVTEFNKAAALLMMV